MGIRFACHICGKHLNIKRDLAGRRGVCPACSSKFRIPLEDSETSLPVEIKPEPVAASEPTDASSERECIAESAVSPAPDAVSSEAGVEVAVAEAPVVSSVGEISLLDEDADATWYVRPPSGGQYGPASSDVLKQWIGEGRVAASALLWRDGWPQWRDASDALSELADQLPPGQVASSMSLAGDGVGAAPVQSPRFSGEVGVGTDRRHRSMRRVLMIGVLSAVAVTLIGVLIVVANMQGLETPATP